MAKAAPRTEELVAATIAALGRRTNSGVVAGTTHTILVALAHSLDELRVSSDKLLTEIAALRADVAKQAKVAKK